MKWKEMSALYKVIFAVGMLCAFVGAILSVLDLAGILTVESIIEHIFWCVFCLSEGIINWKAQKKLAIVWFAVAGIRLLSIVGLRLLFL